MNKTKIIARKVIFPAIIHTGLEKYIRLLAKRSMVNIMYHGVVPKTDPSFSPRHISVEQFDRHLKYFTKNFTVISLPEAFDLNKNNLKPNKKTLTVSFDDGYKNNIEYALPLLQKYNIQTSFFISSVCGNMERQAVLWTDLIACLLFFYRDEIVEIGGYRFINGFDANNRLNVSDYIKMLSPEERDKTISFISGKYHLIDKLRQVPTEYWGLMDIDDIKKLSAAGLANIGSHGHSHLNLGNIDENEAYAELDKSKRILENICDKPIDMIAYPDGSYTPVIKELAYKMGYTKQLAVDYRYKEDIEDPRILSRFGLSGTTTYESNMFFLNLSFISNGYN